ncbi:MAG: cell surface protein, partial [Mycobacteriaceae bacterium]|nr:cell surface protein [Mycobacteriaceae bacterium]
MKTKTSMAAAGFAAALMASGVALASTASASDLVGPGCADYAAANPTGPASVQGMSMVPVTEAAANNPMLTTLTSAVS